MTSERIESLNELDFKWGYVQSTVWDTRRKELAAYKQQNNGSTNVPQHYLPNQPLANWVNNQRNQYNLFQDGKKSNMTTKRIESLNELDFKWWILSGCWDTLWDTRRKELAAYKQQNNGSTNVPQHYLPNQPLANWVQTQRNLTKLFQDGKTSAMTSERIESLNELDFKWGYVQSTVWDTRRKELATYKQQNNGRTNVPQRFLSNKPLGIWVQKQRQQYKLLREGKTSAMTTERIESLNELDFEWVVSSTVWDTRCKELARYKQQNNGSTNVPQPFPSNKPLGIWVQKQRNQYRLLHEGRNSHMTTERIKFLNELDFEWNPIQTY
jgi:glutaredoxin